MHLLQHKGQQVIPAALINTESSYNMRFIPNGYPMIRDDHQPFQHRPQLFRYSHLPMWPSSLLEKYP